MDAYMFIAFILGFWCIWSANRDVSSLIEALVFTILSIVIKSLMEWSGMPNFDTPLLVTWGILFIFVMVVLELIDFSSNMAMNMTIAVGGAVGWFVLARYLFSAEGMAKVASWLM